MNKLQLLVLVSLCLTACGQKGPLIVDQPINENGQTVTDSTSVDGTNTNNTAARINRQVDGQPSIIQR